MSFKEITADIMALQKELRTLSTADPHHQTVRTWLQLLGQRIAGVREELRHV
ncbi:MAG: hypothetical protein JWP58_3924 [Hymenobacter sp.]|nr:hypothetical protein [Hymenobacter sp.]